MRGDRAWDEFRPMAAELAVVRQADGSARLAQGGTRVHVALQGPLPPAKARWERPDRMTVSVRVSTLAAPPTVEQTATAATLESFLGRLVNTGLHRRLLVSLSVLPLERDGSVLAAMLNAATLAVVDAGLPMHGVLVAVGLAVDRDGRVAVDPTAEEEHHALALATVVVDAAAADARDPDAIVAVHAEGRFAAEHLERMLCAAVETAPRVAAWMGATAERHLLAGRPEQEPLL
jgi:ribonuclease PH